MIKKTKIIFLVFFDLTGGNWYNMSIFDDIQESIENYFKNNFTQYKKSKWWKEYHLGLTKTHCAVCSLRENKIYEVGHEPVLPEHIKCLCSLIWLDMQSAGTATKLGTNGADYFLKYFGVLPDYYITKEEAKKLGWKSLLGNLDKVAPGKMIGGNIYNNKPPYLPEKEGRIWYECDIDYNGGYRNNNRLIFSNDGLIFKTDSHYDKFIAIE